MQFSKASKQLFAIYNY